MLSLFCALTIDTLSIDTLSIDALSIDALTIDALTIYVLTIYVLYLSFYLIYALMSGPISTFISKANSEKICN